MLDLTCPLLALAGLLVMRVAGWIVDRIDRSEPVTALDRAAVAATLLTADEVEAIYGTYSPRLVAASGLIQTIRRLCASHERLRRELKATEELLADATKTSAPAGT